MNIVTTHMDAAMGRWTLVSCRPPHLADYIDGIWHFEGSTTLPRERVLPNGLFELIIQFGEAHRLVEPTGLTHFPVNSFGGLLLGAIVIEGPPRPDPVLGIKLHPAGAYAIVGRAIPETTGLTVDLRDLLGDAARSLEDCCRTATSGPERVRLAAHWVNERVGRYTQDPAVTWTTHQIARARGAISIAGLRSRTGLSKTRFSSVFRDQVGVTPKVYARLLRFRHAVDLLTRRGGPLGDVALDAGYYDQPHFNAEFREMSGLSPTEYLSGARYFESPNLAEAGPDRPSSGETFFQDRSGASG